MGGSVSECAMLLNRIAAAMREAFRWMALHQKTSCNAVVHIVCRAIRYSDAENIKQQLTACIKGKA